VEVSSGIGIENRVKLTSLKNKYLFVVGDCPPKPAMGKVRGVFTPQKLSINSGLTELEPD
jgi:hypothetical protein